MRRWQRDDKELVVQTLAERDDGMYVIYFTFVTLVKRGSAAVLSVGIPRDAFNKFY